MNRTANKSEFALAMAALLDETSLFNRREWAEFLGVSEPAISQWVGDKTIPRPDILFMIVDILRNSTDVPAGPLESFEAMARKPANEVSPHGRRMLPTVNEYMMRPSFSDVSSELAKLSPDEQERLLEQKFLERPVEADVKQHKRGMKVFVTGSSAVSSKKHWSLMVYDRSKPILPCVRSRGFATCAQHERNSWKNILAPSFKLIGSGPNEERPLYEWDQLSTFPHLLIVGAPGSGKTMLLRHLVDTLASAGKSNGEGSSFSQYFHLACLAKLESQDDFDEIWRKSLLNATNSKRILLLLDGFDEVSVENRDGVAKAIFRFRAQNPAARFIISSRPSPDLKAFAEIPWFRIEPLPATRLLSWIREELSERLTHDNSWDEAILTYVSCLRERPDVFREIQSPLLLSHAAELFVRHSLTAHNDADLFQECLRLLLDEWDGKKNIVRSANAWAKPRHLIQWLSCLCYSSLVEERNEFTASEAEAWVQKFNMEAPVEEFLRLISESTGIVQPFLDRRWGIAHATFQEYLAARYIVESSSDATNFVKGWLHAPRMSNVLRFACALTNDASRLLNFILTEEWPHETNRIETLADVLAQPITAETRLIRRGCVHVAEWLDDSFEGWETISVDGEDQISSPKWKLVARKSGSKAHIDPQRERGLVRTLHAVHRARLSPAKPELLDRLRASDNDVVRAVGESLDTNGYLQADMVPQNGSEVLVAQVLQG